MNIFCEIYGSYFHTVAKILKNDRISLKEIQNIINENAFNDSVLFLESKIIPSKNGESDWGIIKRNDDETFSPVTKKKPFSIMTKLQKMWLKAQLSDDRFRLFFDDETLLQLEKKLENVEPLYKKDTFDFYDIYTDGDDFSNKEYKRNFQRLVKATEQNQCVFIKYKSKSNKIIYGDFIPENIEYSQKNNRFRLICTNLSFNGVKTVINISSIKSVSVKEQKNDDIIKKNNKKVYAEIEVSNERNGIERFMSEFASLEKITEFDKTAGKCKVKLSYNSWDEAEILVRLLGFGTIIKVNSPERLVNKIKERVKKQYCMMKS